MSWSWGRCKPLTKPFRSRFLTLRISYKELWIYSRWMGGWKKEISGNIVDDDGDGSGSGRWIEFSNFVPHSTFQFEWRVDLQIGFLWQLFWRAQLSPSLLHFVRSRYLIPEWPDTDRFWLRPASLWSIIKIKCTPQRNSHEQHNNRQTMRASANAAATAALDNINWAGHGRTSNPFPPTWIFLLPHIRTTNNRQVIWSDALFESQLHTYPFIMCSAFCPWSAFCYRTYTTPQFFDMQQKLPVAN